MSDERTVEERIEAFRTKFPDRTAQLEGIVLRLIQPPFAAKLSEEAQTEIARPSVDAVIAASWGLTDG